MDFMSHYVIVESPNFYDLRLSPANTADKLKSVFVPTARVEGLMDNSDWLASRNGCEEVTVGGVSKAKAFSNYIKILSLKLPNFLRGKIVM